MTNTAVESPNWIPDTKTFAARLALVRWRMGWNLKEASLACGFAQNNWSGWEEGRDPRGYVNVVDQIVKYTSVDRLWLMTGEGSPDGTVVGPTGLEPMTSTVEDARFTSDNDILAIVTPIRAA